MSKTKLKKNEHKQNTNTQFGRREGDEPSFINCLAINQSQKGYKSGMGSRMENS